MFFPYLRQLTSGITHKIFNILAVLLLFVYSIRYTAIVVCFELNRDIVSRTLCVKKEVQNNKCQGKCFLSQKLEEAEDREEQAFAGFGAIGDESLWDLTLNEELFFLAGVAMCFFPFTELLPEGVTEPLQTPPDPFDFVIA